MYLRSFVPLFFCCILPLCGEDRPSIPSTISGALRKSGIPAGAQGVSVPLKSTFVGFKVEVLVNGKPLELILDTGSDVTLLSKEVAQRLNLQVEELNDNVTSSTGAEVVTRRALTKRISIGDAWSEGEPVWIGDMIAGEDGLLGMGTLADWDVRFDPLAKKLTLFPTGEARPLEGETVVPLTCELVIPQARKLNPQAFSLMSLNVPVRLGKVAITATPVSGFGGTIVIPDRLMEKFAPTALKAAQPGLVTQKNLSGDVVTRSARLPEFAFGPDSLQNVLVSVTGSTPGSKAENRALLGMNLLRHYVMTFRFAAGELRLKPIGTVQEITSTSTAGINMDSENKIISVVRDGPAEKAGLHAGDKLLEIEGHPLKSMKPEELAAFKRLPPGSLVKVSYSRGESSPVEAKLVLAKE